MNNLSRDRSAYAEDRVRLAILFAMLVLIMPRWCFAAPEVSPAGEPEMVVELRAWFVVPKLGGVHAKDFARGKGFVTPQMLGIISGPLVPGDLVIGGDSLVMRGNELRWGDHRQPTVGDVTHILGTTVGLRADQKTMVRANLNERIQQPAEPAHLDLILQPGKLGLETWVTAGLGGRTRSLPVGPSHMHLFLSTPHDQWQALLIDIPTAKGKRSGTLLLFWKAQPATADLITQIETGDRDDCRITQTAAAPFTGLHAVAGFKFMHVSESAYDNVMQLIEQNGLVGDPGSSGIRRVQDPQALIQLLCTRGGSELLSAPRVTFKVMPPGGESKIVQREDQKDCFFDILKASASLAKFWEEAQPTVVVADYKNEYIIDAAGNEKPVYDGLITAMSVVEAEGLDTLAVRLFVEERELKRHKRGLAFWEPRRPPEVSVKTSDFEFACALGDTLLFETSAPDNKSHRLILLTINKAVGEPTYQELDALWK